MVCEKRHGVNEFHTRAACVTEIVRQLQRRAVGRLVLESRQDDRDDVRIITRARAKEPSLMFEHRTARQERALWLADAVRWAVGAGPPWTNALGSALIEVIETDPRDTDRRSSRGAPTRGAGDRMIQPYYQRWHHSMKVSVSLPDDDVEYLDAYARERGLESRSAVAHKAVRLLRASELGAAYEEAWADWEAGDDAELWDSASADGLG